MGGAAIHLAESLAGRSSGGATNYRVFLMLTAVTGLCSDQLAARWRGSRPPPHARRAPPRRHARHINMPPTLLEITQRHWNVSYHNLSCPAPSLPPSLSSSRPQPYQPTRPRPGQSVHPSGQPRVS
ncbi:hypothetical protein E2C01_052161 [Portunus trituberculatus]|uniref:Uncharacterized protein n=1 Tax=Portunus trituberculatus TaxID=210409 RepID=A0A5B7GKT9_PORTR|nr:hypothetical protein [Portunus trituberculatus]